MIRKSAIGMAVLWVGLFSLFPYQEAPQSHSPNLSVDLEFRALCPGEIVLISLKNRRNIQKACLRFLGEQYEMSTGPEQEKSISFIGLDLGIESGTYPIEISVLYADGSYENVKREIMVLPKAFPEKKLWVKQKYVTPPPEVQERIRTEATLLRDVYNIYTTEWLGEGKFIIPTKGKILPNFGERRILNNQPRSSHSGVDISSPLGNPVRASNSGRVVLAHDLYFAGRTVIIDHGLGVFTLYCHFSRILTQRGKYVKKGDIIGEIGATGRVTGPHLHWGVKVSGSRIDPFSLLSLPLD